MDSSQEKSVYEGLTVCWRCGRTVKGKMVIRGEENLSYLIYDCPVDGVYEDLMGKGSLSYRGLISEDIPSSWPRWEPQQGMMWDDSNVINRENIPVLVFAATTVCNSSCKICSFPELQKSNIRHPHLDIEFMKEKLAFYKNKNKEVILCGGEVTTRQDLPELIKMIKATGNEPVIQTNGLKLANLDYVRCLKKAGMEHVHFSFDGFKEEIYEKVRGGKHEYALKLEALNNLVKENMRVSLTSVILKGVNDDQIADIIHYAEQNRNIIEIAFLCFCLTPRGIKNGFSTDNLLASEEVRKLTATALSTSEEEFILWDEFKINLAFFIDRWKKRFPFLPLPVFRNGMIYRQRTKYGIKPLLTVNELHKLILALKANRFREIFSILGPKAIRTGMWRCLAPGLSEDLFYYRANIFKISVISPLITYCFAPTSVSSFGFYNPLFEMYNKIHQR